MLIELRANKKTFKTLVFKKGLNIILADSSESSSEKDSRNGVGKTSLIEILHFCLGGKAESGKGVIRDELSGWEFYLVIKLRGKRITVCRSVDLPSKIYVKGESLDSLPLQTKKDETGENYYGVDTFNKVLGSELFGLSHDDDRKFIPSNRMLMSYFARKGLNAYTEAFKYFPMQKSWQTQVSQTYLLGLSHEIAREIAVCKEEKKALDDLKKSIETGVLDSLVGNIGQFESEIVNLDTQIEVSSQNLDEFKVHPQYKELEIELNLLTKEIQSLSNDNIIKMGLINSLESSFKSENSNEKSNLELIKKVYSEAGAVFKDSILRTIEEVQSFHSEIIKNRKDFFKDEIKKNKNIIKCNTDAIEIKSEKKSEIINILNEHKAIEELILLRQKHSKLITKRDIKKQKLNDLKKIRNSENEIKLKVQGISLRASQDYDERESDRKRLMKIFSSNTRELYEVAGSLIVNVDRGGYKFSIKIERDASAGVSKMEIFCYDMMLAEVWQSKKVKPGFFVHDSTIFSDVDERQIYSAVSMAKKKSEDLGFQYICLMNSDKVPSELLSDKENNIKSDIILRLKDDPEEDCLFGFRF